MTGWPALNYVRKNLFHSPEIVETAEKYKEDDDSRKSEQKPVNGQMSQGRGPKGLDHTAHGVEGQQPLVFLLDHADRVDDRRDKHPQLDKKGYHIPDIPILNIEGRQPQTDTNGAEESQTEQKWKKQNGDTWDEVIVYHQGAQNEHGDEKIEQTGQGCRGRDN